MQGAGDVYSFSACDQLVMEMLLSVFLSTGGSKLPALLLVSSGSRLPQVGVETAGDWCMWHYHHTYFLTCASICHFAADRI